MYVGRMLSIREGVTQTVNGVTMHTNVHASINEFTYVDVHM